MMYNAKSRPCLQKLFQTHVVHKRKKKIENSKQLFTLSNFHRPLYVQSKQSEWMQWK